MSDCAKSDGREEVFYDSLTPDKNGYYDGHYIGPDGEIVPIKIIPNE